MANLFQDLVSVAQREYDDEYNKKQKKVKQYEPSGLLEGLNESQKVTMATLLDNQFNRVLIESINNTNIGGATFQTGAGEQWAGIVLPMVRKIFADTISAKEFVSIQPLSVPNGLIFFLDFKYGTTKAPFTQGDSVYGTTNVFNKTPSGGLYGSGRFGYSLNATSASVATTVTSGSFQDILFDSNLSGSLGAGEIKKVAVPFSGIAGYDPNTIMAYTISGSGVSVANTFANLTTSDGTNVYFIVSGSSANVASATRMVTYQLQTKDNFRGDYEDRGNGLPIADYDMDFRSESIVAHTRKLKGSWTQEMVTDVKKLQGIDVENELTSLMAGEVAKEMDLEVLDMLLKEVTNTGTRLDWSYANNTEVNATKTGIVPLTSGYYNDQPAWFSTLGVKVNAVSNKILQKIVRGSANFMVISPEVANIFESMHGYSSDADISKVNSGYGAKASGTFNSQYKVYKNPLYTSNRILMGFKGSEFLETGAVLAPYVPLEVTPNIYNPQTGTQVKIMSTRYATKVVRGEFYGDVLIAGLPTY
jgi:Major capsid protein Gp23